MVRLLLEHGAQRDFRGLQGQTAAAVAMEMGYHEVVEALTKESSASTTAMPIDEAVKQRNLPAVAMLLKQGADPNASIGQSGTLLSHATRERDADMIRVLLVGGADPHRLRTWSIYPDGAGPWLNGTPWMDAIASRDPQMAAAMADHMPELDEMVDGVRLGDVLLRSSLYNSPSVAAWLLGRGYDVNTVVEPGGTALMIVAQMDKAADVKVLLDLGADPSIRRADGKSALDLTSSAEIRRTLTDAMANASGTKTLSSDGRPSAWLADYLLWQAARDGEVEGVRRWLALGASSRNYHEGWPPLGVAAANGHVAVIDVLLGHNADVNAAGDGGWTPLMQAAARGRAAAVHRLLSAGAKADARNEWKTTAADLAHERGHAEIAAILRAR